MIIKKNSKKSGWWFLLALILVAAIFVRVLLPTGVWECYNGEWVKRGNPETPRPESSCSASDDALGKLIAETESVLGGFNTQGEALNLHSETASKKEAAAIVLQSPDAKAAIVSPLAVTGLALDDWFYQGELLITLEDANQQVIAKHFATKQPGSTTAPGYSSFSAWVDFETSAKNGYLLIYKNKVTATGTETDFQRWPVQFK